MKLINTISLNNLIILSTITLFLISTILARSSLKTKLRKNSQCNNWTGQLSPVDKQVIVNAHNWFRNEIALQTNTVGPKIPFATNMIQMYWSDAIAAKAQQWANGCKFSHSGRDFRRQPQYPTGENLYYSAASNKFQNMDWNKAISAWYHELKDFAGKSVDRFNSGGPVTGHFTQVIWANSYNVGCGFAQYKEGNWFKSLYVCEYGPVGNIIGLPIYRSSPTRACNCPQGLSCGNPTFPGLCCPAGACTWQSQVYNGPVIPGTVPSGLQKK